MEGLPDGLVWSSVRKAYPPWCGVPRRPRPAPHPNPQQSSSSDSNLTLRGQNPPVTLSWSQKRESVTADRVGAHAPERGKKARVEGGLERAGEGGGLKGAGAGGLRLRHAVESS